MKKLIVVILSLVLVFSLVACGGSEDPVTTEAPETPSEEPAAPAVADLSKVDVEIAFGDFDGMQAFQQKLANFEAENFVVKIDATIEKLGSNYSLMEHNADGSGLGVTVVVDGWADADYPADDTHVQVLGAVVTDGWNHYISVLPENFTVVPEN